MPYGSVAELPDAQTEGMTEKEKRIFLEVFNRIAYRTGEKSRAFARAHAAVNQEAGRRGRRKPKNRRG